MGSSRLAPQIRSAFAYLLIFFIYVYTIALTSSMAAMELGMMGVSLFFILYALADKFSPKKTLEWHTIGAEFPILGFIIVAVIGLLINDPGENLIYPLGSLRTFLFLFLLVYSLQVVKNLNRIMLVLIFCATVVAGYAIWQHYSGIDLWRQNHRALMPLPGADQSLYRSVGLFSHPLTYGHSYMMLLCLPFAGLILSKDSNWWQRALLLVSFLIMIISVVFTYGRGVWIAVAIALPAMAFFVSRKLLITAVILMAVVGGIAFKYNTMIHDRVMTLFAENYESNEDRKKLWQANMEMFHEHPWLGIGYRQNENQTAKYYEKLGIKDGMAGNSHSNYVEILATTGILGFGFYMLFILSFVLMAARLFSSIPHTHYWHRVFALSALGAQVAFHVGGLTQCNFQDAEVHNQYLFWLAVVAYMSQRYYAHIVPDDHSL